jgi:hypothetical protein
MRTAECMFAVVPMAAHFRSRDDEHPIHFRIRGSLVVRQQND